MKRNPRQSIWYSIILVLLSCNGTGTGGNINYFKGPNAEFEKAIEQDDATAVIAAIRNGADANAQGLHSVTPLIMAVGKLKKQAAAELLRQGADTSQRDGDGDGDNAVTLAVTAYQKDPQLLEMVLAARGDPNIRESDGDPVIVRKTP